MRFANDFHSWLRHSWKLLANRLTRDPKIVIHSNSCIILYISQAATRSSRSLNGNENQGWGQVLSEVLESSTSTFKICKLKYKYKYSQYLDGIKYIKYFFSQVQVQVPSTLVTNNSTVSLWVQNSFTTITLVHTVTYKVKNTFQICTKITFILWNQPWIDKLCICHPTQLMPLWIMWLVTEDHDYLLSLQRKFYRHNFLTRFWNENLCVLYQIPLNFLVIHLTILIITGSVNCLVLNRPHAISRTTELTVIDFTDENRFALLGLND